MSIDETRLKMADYRQTLIHEASSFKTSFYVQARLRSFYSQIGGDERKAADRVLADWALSDDAALRFDALDLIREFSIVTAVPALRELAQRLRRSTVPGATDEMALVNRVAADLGTARGAPGDHR